MAYPYQKTNSSHSLFKNTFLNEIQIKIDIFKNSVGEIKSTMKMPALFFISYLGYLMNELRGDGLDLFINQNNNTQKLETLGELLGVGVDCRCCLGCLPDGGFWYLSLVALR